MDDREPGRRPGCSVEWDRGQPVLVGDEEWDELPTSPVIRVRPDTLRTSPPTRGERQDDGAQR